MVLGSAGDQRAAAIIRLCMPTGARVGEVAGLNSCVLALTRAQFKAVTDNGVVAGELIWQGLGIGVMLKEFAVLLPGVEPVLPDPVALPVPFWLTTHRELLTNRRIRVAYDLLAEAFS